MHTSLTVPSGYFTPGAKAAIPQDSTPSISMPRWRYVFRKMTPIPPTEVTAEDYHYGLDGKIPFNPSPRGPYGSPRSAPDWDRSTTDATGNYP